MAEVLAEHGLRQLHVGRDGEVRTRDVLLQRRPRTTLRPARSGSSSPTPRDVASYDQKPEMSAAEVAARFVAAIGSGLRFRRRQLREPRHGRPHRRDPGGRRGGRDGRPCLGRVVDAVDASRRCLPRHRRPRQRRDDARRRRRRPHTAHTTNPVPVDSHRRRASLSRAGDSPRSHRRFWLFSGLPKSFRNDRQNRLLDHAVEIGLYSATLSLPQPDPGVLRKAQKGDERAFAIILRMYETPVFNYVLRMVGDRTLAEDLTQEVFLRVFQGLPRFSSRSKFTTWLFQVTKNRVLDELRANERRPRTVVDLEDARAFEVSRRPVRAARGDRRPLARVSTSRST